MKMFSLTLLLLCFAGFNAVQAQCSSSQVTLDMWNTTNCDMHVDVHTGAGGNIQMIIAANSSYSSCLPSASCLVSAYVVPTVGGTDANVDAGTPSATGNQCGSGITPTYTAIGHGFCGSWSPHITLQIDN